MLRLGTIHPIFPAQTICILLTSFPNSYSSLESSARFGLSTAVIIVSRRTPTPVISATIITICQSLTPYI